MLKLITMPAGNDRTYWTLTVLGQPVAVGHASSPTAAVEAAMRWCANNGYEPHGLAVTARTGVPGGERVSYDATL